MKQLFLLSLITLTLISTGYAQTQRIYLDSVGRITTQDKAFYYEEWEQVKAFLTGPFRAYYRSGQLKTEEHYVAEKRQGLSVNYYKNGQLASKGSYYEGLQEGVWEYWYESGQLKEKATYILRSEKIKGEKVKRSLRDGTYKKWYENGQLAQQVQYKKNQPIGIATQWQFNGQKVAEYDFGKGMMVNGWDQNGTQLVFNGYGTMKHYDSKGRLLSSGTYQKGMKVGDWIYYTIDGEASIKNFDREKQKINRFEVNMNLSDDRVFNIVEESAEPIGGMESFYMYIKANLKYPKAAKRLGHQGKVFLSFIINKKGEVTNVEVLKPVSFGLDREALRILRGSPNWKAGKQKGRPVDQRMTFPLNFVLR